jgi:prepilin peptidase CpaA
MMEWQVYLLEHWPGILVSATLIVAASFDGKQLRVPNAITFPLVFSGLAYNTCTSGWDGFATALIGVVVGLACLLPLYSVGGIGAGDVKLLAGIGAWLGCSITFWSFCASAFAGAAMALWMVWRRHSFIEHYANVLTIVAEWIEIRDPRQLSRLAAERQPRMLLIPFAVPICIGSIANFIYAGIV